MNIQWQNQYVLLTGASGGIGSEIAYELDRKGAHLILCARNENKLHRLNEQLSGSHTLVVADITTPHGREKIHDVSQSAPLSMLINNAGITQVGKFTDMQIDSVITTNLTAPMLLTQRLLPILTSRPTAYVVNIGSAFGNIGFAAHGGYCAAKFGLRGWTEAMIREYSDKSVKFFYLAPRATRTAINDEKATAINAALGNHIDEPNAVANTLISQLEQDKRRHSIGFSERFFAQLNGLFPRLIDKALAKKLPIIERCIENKESL